ncbi:hypothetical protein PDE_07474 [Penicillium oxalicum 114-2]|uniref:Uncharacterized protein n=1 Tax=Penicillium oxalicum (strain 114-2 / CGMCC 5302) TaxID=933388 RepID=S7ZQ33_PENO1|nr:hypothetical protein PDE_07474 [Penicillium oxalicum 114-2]
MLVKNFKRRLDYHSRTAPSAAFRAAHRTPRIAPSRPSNFEPRHVVKPRNLLAARAECHPPDAELICLRGGTVANVTTPGEYENCEGNCEIQEEQQGGLILTEM